jgi:hypothetical protein
MRESPVSRSLCLAFVLAGALGAVAVRDERTSSFLAGFGAGTGVLFILSFLRNPRTRAESRPSGGESPGHDEHPDR